MTYKALILKAKQVTPFHLLNPYCYKVQESLPCSLKTTIAGAFSRILCPIRYFFQTSKKPIFTQILIEGKPILQHLMEAGILIGPPDTQNFTSLLETIRVWRTEAPRGRLISSIVQREWLLSSSAVIYAIFTHEKVAKICEKAVRDSPVMTVGKSENIFTIDTKNTLMYEAEEREIDLSESPVPDKYIALMKGGNLLLPLPMWDSQSGAYKISNFFVPYQEVVREKNYKKMQYQNIELRGSISGYKIHHCKFVQHVAKTI